MARARKTTGIVEAELIKLLTNPFARFEKKWSWTRGEEGESPPWIDPHFPRREAERLWRAIRQDVLVRWRNRYPRREHWAETFFTRR
ncbi:MAG: hypothetical protein HOP18_14785 [Deltaproteobacteria bacterium]|nr:hypothetical protein [Deltaproteobacteria bacterium]